MSEAADMGWLLKGVLVLLVLAALLAPAWLVARRGGYGRRAWLQAGAFFGAAVFALLAAAVVVDLNIPGDHAASVFFQDLHLSGQTHRIEQFTSLGGWYVVLPVTALLALVVAYWSPRAALYLATAVVVSTLVNVAMKGLFQRVPPGANDVESIILSAFPSGHAMRTMTLAIALAIVLPRRRWSWPTALATLAVAVLVGLSRIYLEDHYFSDVVGGWALALFVAAALALVWPGLDRERAKAATAADEAVTESTGSAGTSGSTETGDSTETGGSAGTGSANIRVVLLDWGDTLMVDDGREGPMAEWPEVTAVADARETLVTLGEDYVIAVATNADDSGAAQVEAALGRVGLARHVDRVFSSRDIGARKPEPAFYAAVLRALDEMVSDGAGPLRTNGAGRLRASRARPLGPDDPGPLLPQQVVMVGDDYANDVAGAKAAGLRTVWFDQAGRRSARPAESAHDAVIGSLSELPAALARLATEPAPIVGLPSGDRG